MPFSDQWITPGGRTEHQARFAQVPSAEIPRSAFDRSHGLKTAFDGGFLIPIFADEALPGDTMSMQPNYFARLSTPTVAVIENMYIDTFWFAVPNRLLWDNWNKFMGEQTDPGDSISFVIPEVSSDGTGHLSGSLYDHLGIPILVPGLVCSNLWGRAYNLIFNEWFRSEDLTDSLVVDTNDGPDTVTDYVIKRRGKRHDYFTSCLPFTQKGTPIQLPLGTSAPVVGVTPGVAPTFDFDSGTATGALEASGGGATFSARFERLTGSGPGAGDDAVWLSTGLETDLTAATAATINQIREAFQIQRLLERDARGGTRYTEIIRSHFGVTSPDSRLQRPEYLGGATTPIQVNVVAHTATTGDPTGFPGAMVTAASQGRGWTKSFTEHCVIIGLVNVRADLSYQQGMERQFSRSTRFDFFWPALSNLGEQAVLNKEIFAQGSGDLVADAATFGFQERYAEYRYKPSIITGKMRSADPLTLDFWHLSQDFAALPLLNNAFIEDNPPFNRILVNVVEPEFVFDAFFQYRCVRPMPTYGVPGLIDHF